MGVNIINAYHQYKNARDAAWRCLINTQTSSLPVKTLRVAAFYGVKVVKNSAVHHLNPSESGCTFVNESGEWKIVYDDTEGKGRMRFTIAHELGHILLGHELSDSFGHFRTASDKRAPAETQADEFAVRLLAPPYVCKL